MKQDARLRNGVAIQGSASWYKVVQPLGAGVNASTHLVVATSGAYKGIPFALKMFGRLEVPERLQDFDREIAFLKTCSHPSVMRTFDEGFDPWQGIFQQAVDRAVAAEGRAF